MDMLSSAIAFVDGDKLVMANARWTALTAPSEGSGAPRAWRATAGDGEPGRLFESLDHLVITQAAELRPGHRVVSGVFERVGSGDAIELELELLDRPGQGPVALAVARDVTERVSVEREIRRTQKALEHQSRMRVAGELASGIAHDLNNVLGSLVLRVALLQSDATCMSAQGDNVQAIMRIIKDAAARVGRLHELARRPRAAPTETLELGVIINEAIEMVRAEVEDKTSIAGAPVHIVAGSLDVPPVSGHSAADVRHVFIDLILSARDAEPKGGTIEISAERRAGTVVVTVADSGLPIADGDLGRLFDPVFGLKAGRGGLGLSNAYDMMSALGGSIKAANRESGGVAFTLTFPLADRLVARKPAEPAASPDTRVLLIDSDGDHRMLAKALIELLEQEVDVVSSASEALSLLTTKRVYRVALCDAADAGVVQEIRSLAPKMRIHLLAQVDEPAPNDALRSLVDGVIEKPVTGDRLRAIFRTA